MASKYPRDWSRRRKEVISRDDERCQAEIVCNGAEYPEADIEVHHLLPKSEGGSHYKRNLVTVCRECHEHIHHGDGEPPRHHQNVLDKFFERAGAPSRRKKREFEAKLDKLSNQLTSLSDSTYSFYIDIEINDQTPQVDLDLSVEEIAANQETTPEECNQIE